MAFCGNISKTALLLSCYLCIVLTCSCPEESSSISREDTIQNYFFSSLDIYTAVLKEVDCRCYTHDPTRINCLRLFNDSGLVYTEIPKRYKCDSGFSQYDQDQFQMCNMLSDIIRLAAPIGFSEETVPGPLINVTGEKQCGLLETDGSNCQLSTQPCFYNVSIINVYKGDYQMGDVVTTTGPDVLTSCGTPMRLLSFGIEYVVGIGGACSPIQEWTPLAYYDENEVEQLLELQEQCADNPSSCNGSKNSLLMAASPLLLLSLLFLLLAM